MKLDNEWGREVRTINDDSAFPNMPVYDGINRLSEHGLTKREYFAAMAMQGLLMRDEYIHRERSAEEAVYFADALIAELNKGASDE